MSVKWKKLLAAISCWTVIVLGVVEGAEYVPTIDGIVQSVVAVRSQLEPVLRNRLEQRTSPLQHGTRTGGLSCGGVIRLPGLQRLFKCVPPENQPAYTAQDRIDNTQPPPAATIIADTRIVQGDLLRANPLGLLFPNAQQINQFSQWQRPYQGPTRLPATTTTTTTTTTTRPQEGDFYFPQNEDDRFEGFGTVKPAPYYTTPTTSHAGPQHWENSTTPATSTDGSDVTQDALEEATTEPTDDENGLGNRIDQKLLLSLVG
uniref:Uncharacterized protein n=1 Tax=Anopheles dirus TaxID=7168 RepID=A0A182NRG0_9DIPT